MTATPLLDVQGLTRRFGGLVAVDGLDLTVQASEIVGLLGPNGSGKTTALNLISGALKPDRGSIALRGGAIAGLAPHKIARLGVARTFQLVRVLGSMRMCWPGWHSAPATTGASAQRPAPETCWSVSALAVVAR